MKDQLDTITHNGFDYSFTYDTFGNPLSTKVAGQTLSTNIYGPRNGFLERMNYGNGAYIEYLYDSLYRVNSTWLNGIQQTRLLYDSQGTCTGMRTCGAGTRKGICTIWQAV